jgi:two-component sensor histidine kinase
VENGQLDIIVDKKEASLFCIIDDNGIGMKNSENLDKPRKSKSFGTSSGINRLDLLNKIKGNSLARINSIQKDEGVRVEIQLPLVKNFAQ